MSTPIIDPEKWLPVVGHEERYEVSDHGNVRRIDATFRRRSNGNIRMNSKQRYLRISLFSPSRRVHASVHALVAEAFIGARPLGFHVDHIDGNTRNNRPENLRYVTCQVNNRDRTRRILATTGKAKVDGKLTAEDVQEIRRLRKEGVGPTTIARKFGVAQPFVSQIISGVKWTTL